MDTKHIENVKRYWGVVVTADLGYERDGAGVSGAKTIDGMEKNKNTMVEGTCFGSLKDAPAIFFSLALGALMSHPNTSFKEKRHT